MKVLPFVLFFGVVFTVYGLLNYYIFVRGWQAIPHESPLRTIYLVIFLLLALAFIAGRFLERAWLSPLSETLVWLGSFWLAAMLYFILGILLLDLARLINHYVPFFPSFVTADYQRTKGIAALILIGIVAVVLVIGNVNALLPVTRSLALAIPKKVNGEKQLRIAVASDIHLGTVIGRRRFDRIVERIDALQPDVILLPGDIVDEDLGPVIRENLGERLRGLTSRYGVYAVTGNHEYIGGVEAAVAYLREHGVTVLRDEAHVLPDGVTIVGREDRSLGQMARGKRKELENLLAGVDMTKPVILMDHQPFHLEEAERCGVDLQLSGHTHHGQLWPLNYITKAIYEVSMGYKKKGNTHIYVSCGIGTWGPPVRTGNRPELLDLVLTFQ
jgi:predicted MPP superfamily phosphohydrolase